jgi:hypothetical protein
MALDVDDLGSVTGTALALFPFSSPCRILWIASALPEFRQVVTWVVPDRRVRTVHYPMSGYGGSGERRAVEVLFR